MTIYDIAKKADVSVATVSRVINDKGGVGKETRERVKNILSAEKFTPSLSAQNLATRATRLIGVLAPDIRNEHNGEMAYIIEQLLAQNGYDCFLCNTGLREETQKKYLEILASRNVDGVILLSSNFQTSYIQKQIKNVLAAVPVVMVNGYLTLPNIHAVICDEYSITKQAVHYYVEKGYKKFVFIMDNPTASNKLKLRGFKEALEEFNFAKEDYNVVQSSTSIKSKSEMGFEETKLLMDDSKTAPAIIFSEDDIAAGGLKYLLENGYSVPEDAALMAFNNSKLSKISVPGLTSIENGTQSLSEAAVNTLFKLLQGGVVEKKVYFPAKIHFRQTT